MSVSKERIAELDIACKRAYNNRIQYGSGGNSSIVDRDEKKMLIKASGYSFADDVEIGCTYCDYSGKALEEKKPSSEAFLHGYLYEKFLDINAIVHVHAPYTVAFSANHEVLPRITKQAMLKMPADLPIIDIASLNVRQEDLSLIDKALETKNTLRAFILKDHGIVAMGTTPSSAEHLAEMIEETAMIAMLRGI